MLILLKLHFSELVVKKLKTMLIQLIANLCFLCCGLVIVEATILVMGFMDTSNTILRTSYGFVYMNVHLNVPEFLLDTKANISNEVKKNIYLIELFKSELH